MATLRQLDFEENGRRETPFETVITRRVRVGAWVFMVLAGAIETVAARHAMQDDGVNYLDLGDAIMRRDWSMALNGIWSPLYPFLQALALRLFKPGTYSQFTIVHCVNFLIYLFTLACFEYLLHTAIADRPLTNDRTTTSFPQWTIFAIGYAVFMWSTLTLITIRLVSPDMLMAGFVYLAVGLLLRIWERKPSLTRYLLLGTVLGLGYLAKAPVFPLAFIFFVLAWFLSEHRRGALAGVLGAALVFLAVGAPWFVALSHAKGRFTFGDSGRFNYEVHVNGISAEWFFQDLGTAGGHYIHRVRKIFDNPPIFEFPTPNRATSSVSYDPSYWAEGAIPRVTMKRELITIHHWLEFYLDDFFSSQTGLFVGFVVLLFMAGRERAFKQVTARWPIWLVGLAGLTMYALVYAELRYVAVFFCLVWVGLFSGLRVRSGSEGRSTAAVLAVAVVVATAGSSVLPVVDQLGQLRKNPPHKFWQIAHDLQGLGVKTGDRVARLPDHYGLAWGRLLGVTEVARIPEERAADFWCAKPETQAQAMEALRRLNVAVFVAEQPPPTQVCAASPEWHRIGDGTYYALLLHPEH
jgi:4-amino-4-deoxy-L-arabinose transferase-like glycosyltransferase